MRCKLFALILVVACGTAARADLVATSVAGSLSFGSSTNYFLSSNGYVPAGYENSSTNPVTIGPGVEFGFQDGANLDTADFFGNRLTVTDVVSSNAGPFEMDFTDSAFTFADLLSSNGYTYSFSGNTLKVLFAGASAPGTYTATFAINSAVATTPEPSSVLLFGTGLLGMTGIARRRLFSQR